jgi:hypothetical protein
MSGKVGNKAKSYQFPVFKKLLTVDAVSSIILINVSMTENPRLLQLFLLLDKAEEMARQFTGGYSNHFFSAQEFHAALANSIAKLKAGDRDQLNDLWLWFAPTYDWDDFIHQDGQDLANQIFPLLTELRNELQG